MTACYASWGRNYLRFGYGPSSGAPIKATGITPASGPLVPRQLYTHRPPTVSLLVSVACRLFGPTEGALRGVGVLASLGTLAVFMALAVRLLGPEWGLVASALFAFIPDFAFYGVTAAHQTFGVLGALAIFVAALRWEEHPTGLRLAVLLGVVAAACWLDWPAFYGAGAAGLLLLATAREKRWVGLLLPLSAVLSLGVFVYYLYRLDPVGREALHDFLSTGSAHSGRMDLGSYVAAHVREAVRWFTVPVLLLSAIGAGQLRPRAAAADAAIWSTVILGADSVLFTSLTYGHLFMTVPLVPFAALTAARGLRLLWTWKASRIVAAVLAAGFVVQGALTLTRAHRAERFPYVRAASHALATALQRNTAPGERSLVKIYVDKHLVGYYADRPVGLYAPTPGTIDWLDEVRVESGAGDAALIRRLEEGPPPFAWFVTTTWTLGRERIAPLAAESEAGATERYDLESGTYASPFVAYLRERYPETRRDGFIFFDLRKRR